MDEIDLNSNFYKTPSTEIIRHRKEFYNLWKRCDDETGTWLNRLQSQIHLCEFPPVMSHEYILIDKFVCELNDNEREFIQSVDTWSLEQLTEYFLRQKVDIVGQVNTNHSANNIVDENSRIPSLSMVHVKGESVSAFKI